MLKILLWIGLGVILITFISWLFSPTDRKKSAIIIEVVVEIITFILEILPEIIELLAGIL